MKRFGCADAMKPEEIRLRLKPINVLRWGKCELRKALFNLGRMKRSIVPDSRYDRLRLLKNAHTNERCFIICTGPSLTVEDVLLLRGEFTIGMNSICKLFSQTDWRPSVYGIQDLHVYDRLENELKELDSNTLCFAGDNVAAKRRMDKKWIPFPLYTAYHDFDKTVLNKYYARFSEDCRKVVYNGYSITYSLLQIAVYMGFKEIYILGADNNYSSSGKQHFMEHGHFASDADKATFRLNAAYQCAKEYADAHGVYICNVTRGGMLELFPRKKLEEVLDLGGGHNENSSVGTC